MVSSFLMPSWGTPSGNALLARLSSIDSGQTNSRILFIDPKRTYICISESGAHHTFRASTRPQTPSECPRRFMTSSGFTLIMINFHREIFQSTGTPDIKALNHVEGN